MEFPKFMVRRSWVDENEVQVIFHDVDDDVIDAVETTIKNHADSAEHKEDFINEYKVDKTIGEIFVRMINNSMIRRSPITRKWTRVA